VPIQVTLNTLIGSSLAGENPAKGLGVVPKGFAMIGRNLDNRCLGLPQGLGGIESKKQVKPRLSKPLRFV